MQLYVVRHGETWANAEHRYLGSLDPALTERGRQQAATLGRQLPENLHVLVTSPRVRAVQTASILNQRLGLLPEVMESFRERDVGVFEGLTQAEAMERYTQLWACNITRRWDRAPTNGESIVEVVTRVRAGLIELETRYPSKSVLLVAHGFVAKVIRGLAKADLADFYQWQLPNGSLLTFEDFGVPAFDKAALEASLPSP
ncbi:histidine phosphatase family protein [Pseudomonas sp. CFBP 13719]|uniref:histidine phosphatase family protein n=1 Tax=Pseudomonas sp. CFBP 13719 TaxID=2775303 RepID=UPI001783EE87|nr:histidine phosphatase family protein [Pseudomonas sp. CFBP 13719]MBD8682781.1 histidine phosphatase family protein [Pseudomonas sp. CFBP 13719]